MSNDQWLAFMGGALAVLLPAIVASFASHRAARAQVEAAEKMARAALGAADRAAAAAQASSETAARTAKEVAEQTLQGQRLLARDQALRDHRRAATRIMTDYFDRRAKWLVSQAQAEARGDLAAAALCRNQVADLSADDVSFSGLSIQYRGFNTALERVIELDNAAIDLLNQPPPALGDAPNLQKRLDAAYALRGALVALHAEAEKFWASIDGA